jgi:hypothetical protein
MKGSASGEKIKGAVLVAPSSARAGMCNGDMAM